MVYKARKIRQAKRRLVRRPLVVGAILVAVAIILGVLEATNTTHLLHKKTKAPEIIPITSSTSSSTPASKTSGTKTTNSSTSSNSSNTSSSKNSSIPTSNSGDGPVKPYGDFISNHQPSYNTDPEVSYCTTSPGATCNMTFTKSGSIPKTLPSQTTDSNGSTSWSWNTKTAGLTAGHWDVTVTATLNGKTASATDYLDVGP